MEKAGKERDKENDKLVYLCKPSVSENPIVNLAGILFPLVGLIKIPRSGIHQSTYYSDPRDYYALLSGIITHF